MIDVLLVALMQAVSGDPQIATPAPPVQAQEQTAEQAAEAGEVQEEERVRCRREPIVGTRLSQRICTTPSQDRAMENDARDYVNRAQSQIPLQGN